MSERVFIVGAGKVGRGLAFAFRAAGLQVVGVHARTPREGATSAGDIQPALGDANVVIIAVNDPEIDSVCRDLVDAARAGANVLAYGTVILHTSGMVAPAGYADLRALGFPCGTFHPLAPFSTAELGARAVRDGWVGIDGDATACATARRLAAAIGARTVNIPAGAKAEYHAAAVMASNFPVVLAALAVRVLTRIGVEGHAAEQVVHRLMRGAVDNLEHGSPMTVLTGPAVRNDTAAIAAHRAAIAGDPDALAVYDALTHAARDLSAGEFDRSAAGDAGLIDDAHAGRRGEAEGRARN